ncbi:DUF6074 family protein [Rhizobium rhizogenes]|uniref:DUF6074 family protein n=1 Tax=Rhizobium rhizogenes TaxID=359 RepID=UPI0022C92C19|nr:DUF6074 family protein [Rhizobium rhizogenes]MCZ7488519.1 DUF6074 family protein [Rhizobium rhizogenes]
MTEDPKPRLPVSMTQTATCSLIPFPMANRVGKIRDVASKLIEKHTDRHADYYCKQVTEALTAQFDRLGFSEDQKDEQIGAFWTKVHHEVVRLRHRGGPTGSNNPKGAA